MLVLEERTQATEEAEKLPRAVQTIIQLLYSSSLAQYLMLWNPKLEILME